MNVFVNLNPLNPPLTGIGHYTQNLLRVLLSYEDVQFSGIQNHTWLDHAHIHHLLADEVDKTSQTGAASLASVTPDMRLKKRLRRLIAAIPGVRPLHHQLVNARIQRRLADAHNHIYWEPNFVAYQFPGPIIPTIHDLAFVRYPQFLPKDRLTRLTRQLPDTLNRAAHVVTVSEFSKRELMQVYQIPAEQISVITPAVAHQFHPASPQDQQMVRARYALPEQFFLALGTLEPRKNLANLLTAWSEVPKSLRQQTPLVLVGTPGWLQSSFQSLLDRLMLESSVKVLGYVDQQDLPSLISAAQWMIYVSLYEGFGMPVLEAMACETPVLTSEGTVMAEVAQGHAQLTHPQDPHAMTQSLLALLSQTPQTLVDVQAARDHAQTFTWQHSGQQLYQLLSRYAP